jgi:hypothetical protein
MAYDKMDWHYGGNFLDEFPQENGGTHIGMFLAWAIIHRLSGEFHDEESPDALTAVIERQMTGREFLLRMCDERFWEEDLSDDGNRFASAYYAGTDGNAYGPYIDDYEAILGSRYPTLYHTADSWENYDLIAEQISRRYDAFRLTGSVFL